MKNQRGMESLPSYADLFESFLLAKNSEKEKGILLEHREIIKRLNNVRKQRPSVLEQYFDEIGSITFEEYEIRVLNKFVLSLH